jgi:aryl carrier-like protein
LPAGAAIRVVAADRADVARGERGEIVIRGAGVVAGYEAEAAVNEAAFFDGWLRTGDQGRFDEDGYLYVTGRLKELINRGGEKVSPKEIDEALLEHPQVLEAAAFGVPHPTLGEDVAAAVVVRDPVAVDAPALRAHLLRRLATFKVPSQVLLVDAIPKGATGKVERVTLATRLLPTGGEEYVAPHGDTETTLAAIFAEVLEVERVGANDNFWGLGGDSLRATRALARIRATKGVELPILTLFEHPTVAEAAREVDRAVAAGAAASAASTIRPVAR